MRRKQPVRYIRNDLKVGTKWFVCEMACARLQGVTLFITGATEISGTTFNNINSVDFHSSSAYQ